MAEEKTFQSMNESHRKLGEDVREEISKGTLGESIGRETGRMFDQGARFAAEGFMGHARAFKEGAKATVEGAKTVGEGAKGFAGRVADGVVGDFKDVAEAKNPVSKMQAGMSAAANFFAPTALIKAGMHGTGLGKGEDELRDGFDKRVIKAVGGEVPTKGNPEKSDEGFAHRPAPKVGEGSEASQSSFVGAAGALAGGLQKDAEKKQVDFLKNLDHDVIDQLADTAKHKPEDFRSLAQEVLSKGMHDQKLKDAGKSVDDAVKNSGKDDMEPIRPEKDSSKEIDKAKESSAMKLDGPEIG